MCQRSGMLLKISYFLFLLNVTVNNFECYERSSIFNTRVQIVNFKEGIMNNYILGDLF